jgi:4-aminobutyrate aminotransferase
MAALCERLARIAPGPSRKRVFLTNSGTEATEGAIKLARYATRRTAIIAFRGAFHGRSTGAVTLTSSKARQHAGFGPLLPDVHHVPYAYRYRCQFCADQDECNRGCIGTIEELFARQVDPGDVAAVFVEPVQGEGGYIVPPAGWLRDLRELCDRHGILLVADEVQCGVGRTGRMWACEHEGVEPDILLTAKGLGSGMPIGAIVARETISTWESGSHGSTYGGNPVCCAAALATLDLVESELMANAQAMGDRLMAGLQRLEAKHACIGEVRGLGLMIGVELVKDRRTREPAPELLRTLVLGAFQRGLLLLGSGKSTLRLAPPLVVDQQDVDTALAIIDGLLGELD